jgi:hypothetical protein
MVVRSVGETGQSVRPDRMVLVRRELKTTVDIDVGQQPLTDALASIAATRDT